MRFFQLSVLLAASAGALPQPEVGSGIPSEAFQPRAKQPFTARTDDVGALANKIIAVIVGGAQDYYIPNMVQADVGDVVQFQFSNGNHTVTQSEEASPCSPLTGGVHSGHIPYVDNQTEVGTFNLPVTSTDPMFIYCATGPHCVEGQVMVINPASEDQVVNYAKTAQSQTESIDGTAIIGGTVGTIPLEAAAFVPAAAEEEAAPPGEDPAAGGDAAGGNETVVLSGTVTETVTVATATAAAAVPTA
ncbi:uncharacterized protein MKZ38_005281 [Zalerion maritima]|uniref:Extracellular serine-rich protein n=1 Tax=Zalerion maritima TaxID=339359 RepID=A0AAD5WR23_9PEZI|nr:uncharacterized protein MKZ38_005281 [Zalerion maritima]